MIAPPSVISCSVVSLAPGRLRLGPNRLANRMLLFMEAVLAVSAFGIYREGRIGVLAFLVGAAALLEWARRYQNRFWATIEGDRVRLRPPSRIRERPAVIEYSDPGLSIEYFEWKDDESGEHAAARIRLSPADLPILQIQSPLFFRHRLNREAATARVLVARLRENLLGKPG